MSCGLIGEKIGMTQIFKEDGTCLPVTVVRIEPNKVLDIKTERKHGYFAIQLGFGLKKKNKANRAEKGRFKERVPKVIKEFRLSEEPKAKDFKVGDEIGLDFFEGIRYIDVSGMSVGKGFQGVIKRHNMKGGPASHGSNFHRKPGSIGAATFPAKVWKGQKMPGRMGREKVLVQSLEIVEVDKENQLILIKGSIPGSENKNVLIRKAIKKA